MTRWKMAAELSSDRHLRLIIALYGDDKMLMERHTIEFPEDSGHEVIADKMLEMATKLRGTAS